VDLHFRRFSDEFNSGKSNCHLWESYVPPPQEKLQIEAALLSPFNPKQVLALMPKRRHELRIAAPETVRKMRNDYTPERCREFFEIAQTECLGRWGKQIPEEILSAKLRSFDRHHMIFTFLGGDNGDENLLLIDRRVHDDLHTERAKTIAQIDYVNKNGILNVDIVHKKLKDCDHVTINADGRIFIDLPWVEEKFFIPQLFLLERGYHPDPSSPKSLWQKKFDL
jgi:hypothetical protein